MDPSLWAAFFCLSVAVFLSYWDLRFRRARLERRLGLQPNGNVSWPIMVMVLALWLMLGPLLNNVGVVNYLIIFFTTLILGYHRPVRPLTAAATVAALYPIALLAALLQRVGSNGLNSSSDALTVTIVTLVGVVNVFSVWYLIRVRLKHAEEMREIEEQALAEKAAKKELRPVKSLNVMELGKLYASGRKKGEKVPIPYSMDGAGI